MIGAGAAIAGYEINNEFLNNDFDTGKNKNKPTSDFYVGQIPELDEAQKEAQRIITGNNIRENQKRKLRDKERLGVFTVTDLEQMLQSGQRQGSRQKFRVAVPEYPDEWAFGAQANEQVPRFKQPQDELTVGEGGFSPKFFGFGGGGSFSGGDDAGSVNRFYRVYDVAKTPFGKIKQYVGFYEDASIPNFEISKESNYPIAMGRPMNIGDEDIEGMFGNKVIKKKKSKK